MSLSDYRYRKVRKMIKDAKVSNGVKELMFCGMRQYKKGIIPVQGTYQDTYDREACLVGAALATRLGFGVEPDVGWDREAARQFRIKETTVHSIINGFDSDEGDGITSRTEKLARNINVFLGLSKDVRDNE